MRNSHYIYIYAYARGSILRMLCLCYVLCMCLYLQAQQTFVLYDATGSVDANQHTIQLVDADNGRSLQELGLALLPLKGEVKVYVTELSRGSRLIDNIMNNGSKREISEFYNYYENHPRYVLRPDANGICEISSSLYPDKSFSELCLIVQKENMRAELFPLTIIEEYGGEGACPLYYTNRLKIQGTEKKMVRQINFSKATLQLGDELIFPEVLKIKGAEKHRLVIERTIEMCTFDLDYNLLTTRQQGNNPGIRQLRQLLSHPELGEGEVWHAAPSVFVGKKFEKRLLRRMAGDVMRDSMMLFREDHVLSPEPFTMTGSLRWQMPNIDRYYRLRHTYYLQDFQQADTVSEACTCTRISPLRFFDLPDHVAAYDSIKELQKYYDALPFSKHPIEAGQLAATNLINFYVVNMSVAHEKLLESRQYSDPMVHQAFTACHDSLPALRTLKGCNPDAQKYFEVLTLIRYAEMTLPTDRAAQLIEARDLLTQLFISNPDMIAACQGDRYLRELYRNSEMRQQIMDIYLEAVEAYIQWWTQNQ